MGYNCEEPEVPRALVHGVLCCGLLGLSGCSLLKPEPVGAVRALAEPDDGRTYQLYEPSSYQADRDWPLLVVCHAAPWQSAKGAILDWATLAEDRGLLVLAPELESTADWPPALQTQLQAQQRDEQHILKSLHHVRGAYHIADDQVSIIGTTSGCREALFVGLRHPEVFRCVVLLQPRFDVRHVTSVKEFIDPYQRILVLKRQGDLRGEQTDACLTWLWEQHLTVEERRSSAAVDRYPEIAYDFLRATARRHPWVRVQAYATASPMRFKFAVHSSFPDVYKYEWDFGDGSSDVIAAPEHEYRDAGEYQVTVNVYPNRKEHLTRSVGIQAPSGAFRRPE